MAVTRIEPILKGEKRTPVGKQVYNLEQGIENLLGNIKDLQCQLYSVLKPENENDAMESIPAPAPALEKETSPLTCSLTDLAMRIDRINKQLINTAKKLEA